MRQGDDRYAEYREIAILFIPPQIPQELTGIPEFRWNPSEFAGICLQFTIRLNLKCTYFM